MRACRITDCLDGHSAKGFCSRHYNRWVRYGDPNVVLPARYRTPELAFEARTEWQGDCLVWVGATAHGYGVIRAAGKMVLAHRWAYAQVVGVIPEDLVIDHKCHTRACCNVEHLRAVTHQQNMENLSGPSRSSISGHLNVYHREQGNRWIVQVTHLGKTYYGGSYPKYELHIAAYRAIALRNAHRTYNEVDKQRGRTS